MLHLGYIHMYLYVLVYQAHKVKIELYIYYFTNLYMYPSEVLLLNCR